MDGLDFWYYLIGEEMEKEKGIYLVHHVDADTIAAYLRSGDTFRLIEERKNLPPDLSVYD